MSYYPERGIYYPVKMQDKVFTFRSSVVYIIYKYCCYWMNVKIKLRDILTGYFCDPVHQSEFVCGELTTGPGLGR